MDTRSSRIVDQICSHDSHIDTVQPNGSPPILPSVRATSTDDRVEELLLVLSHQKRSDCVINSTVKCGAESCHSGDDLCAVSISAPSDVDVGSEEPIRLQSHLNSLTAHTSSHVGNSQPQTYVIDALSHSTSTITSTDNSDTDSMCSHGQDEGKSFWTPIGVIGRQYLVLSRSCLS